MKISIHWFRRDLRLDDNTAFEAALKSGNPVLGVFIFDEKIINDLPEDDARISFIYDRLKRINEELTEISGSLLCIKGKPEAVWKKIIKDYDVGGVFTNEDYEPYAIRRDKEIGKILKENDVDFNEYKDQVIFAKDEVLKDNGDPYTVYTPYKNKWLDHFKKGDHRPLGYYTGAYELVKSESKFPSLKDLGFKQSKIGVPDFDLDHLDNYAKERNFPAKDSTSHLSPHLRFGTISPRQVIGRISEKNEVFLSELIWREFFMMILYHFPEVVDHNFRRKYDGVEWRNNEKEFELWCEGKTGFPMVDAGMRELNESGYMHNRVRMITAGFLCKHLLIDWKWGEAYFAEKLLDYELSSNNGNWQWAAGTGCDAAPYFRIFNPTTQIEKFDKDKKYIKKWVSEYGTDDYPEPMVDHKEARERALRVYKAGVQDN